MLLFQFPFGSVILAVLQTERGHVSQSTRVNNFARLCTYRQNDDGTENYRFRFLRFRLWLLR